MVHRVVKAKSALSGGTIKEHMYSESSQDADTRLKVQLSNVVATTAPGCGRRLIIKQLLLQAVGLDHVVVQHRSSAMNRLRRLYVWLVVNRRGSDGESRWAHCSATLRPSPPPRNSTARAHHNVTAQQNAATSVVISAFVVAHRAVPPVCRDTRPPRVFLVHAA